MTATTQAQSGSPPGDVDEAAVHRLYEDFAAANLLPLWTQRATLQPPSPNPSAMPACWPWAEIYPIAVRSGELVPVGRGGERRAIALANPGLAGEPYATPTLWAAIQYLGAHEVAPSHRHVQTAFRFVVEGEGVWTNVEGDAVAMRRGDLLLTPSWHFHEHHNTTDHAMAWIDGLDIPLLYQLDAGFFEYGADQLSTTETPARSRNERMWGYPGLSPLTSQPRASSPLMAYRWDYTDAALAEQLALAEEGTSVLVEPGHAAIRYTNPTTGGDALTTIRTEMHRLRAGTVTRETRVVGSSVWQVFDGSGAVNIGTSRYTLSRGDLFAVPSWTPVRVEASSNMDLFRFGDDPVYEKLGLARTAIDGVAS